VQDTDFWIFREQHQTICGRQLLAEVTDLAGRSVRSPRDQDLATEALIRSGALECALLDAACPAASAVSRLTDALALATVAPATLGRNKEAVRYALSRLQDLGVPETVAISQPEGFAYYGLHPSDFAVAAEQVVSIAPAAVIGIRSIGTTLSAIVAAGLRRSGELVDRITVRPGGHPYARTLQLDEEQSVWIRKQRDRRAAFIIVDEGPGRSGSTFLSVAEALVQAGVPAGQITLMGSHEPDPAALCASGASTRWKAFRFVAAERRPCASYGKDTYLGGGEWRRIFIGKQSEWPPTWPQMERIKFLSANSKFIAKFEGLGSAGSNVRERARCLAASGFGPQFDGAENGFLRYKVIPGPPLRSRDATSDILARIARYCAFRSSELRADSVDGKTIAAMVNTNLAREFNIETRLPCGLFEPVSPVITDARMQPHEWIRGPNALIKIDGVSHGDDHFFPGPVDIAWDIAGTILEWNLSEQAAVFFLTSYQRASGDDVRPRLKEYLLAYAIFRLGWCSMAAPSVKDTPDEALLLAAISRYRTAISHLLLSRGILHSGTAPLAA